MPWSCFMIKAIPEVRRWLRRYASGSTCPAGEHSYHNALLLLDEAPITFEPDGLNYTAPAADIPRDDPRWPTVCPCGYVFQLDDAWQVFDLRLYQRQDTDERCTLRDAPVGAMWESEWLRSMGVGPDGRCLSVMTPGGQWNIDLPSSTGGRWQRTGAPPRITARPSILIRGKYHGWLTDGVLSDDLDR